MILVDYNIREGNPGERGRARKRTLYNLTYVRKKIRVSNVLSRIAALTMQNNLFPIMRRDGKLSASTVFRL